MVNGASGTDSDDYSHWAEVKPAQPKSLSPPQPQKQLSDSYSNTLPVRKNVQPKNSYASGEAPPAPGGHPDGWRGPFVSGEVPSLAAGW